MTIFFIIMYVVGWALTAPKMTLVFAKDKGCHGENRDNYNWNNSSYCMRHCRNGCWREQGVESTAPAVWGSVAGLFWPLLVFAAPVLYARWSAQTIAGRAEKKANSLAAKEREIERLHAEIAKTERELGMRACA